ncbi:MAG: EAL domain-containing protein [SAR324 cluster bacterium]|nr:EAL domain-containing protein [SAR324 cluster bacterium]
MKLENLEDVQDEIVGEFNIYQFFIQSRMAEYINDDMLREISKVAKICEFDRGAVILQEGTCNSTLYFLVQGALRVTWENEYIYSLRRSGDVMGENSVLTQTPSMATVTAETPVMLLSVEKESIHPSADITKDRFDAIFYQLLATVLTDKLKMTTNKAGELGKINVDPLTHCLSRNKLIYDLEHDLKQWKKLSMIYLKIDRFNEVNDGLGFDAGNVVLQKTAESIQSILPQTARIYRFSGAEFAVLIPKDQAMAVKLSETIRGHVQATTIMYQTSRIVITLSIGIADHRSGDILKNAHAALGEAKRMGRTIVYTSELGTENYHRKKLEEFHTVKTGFEHNSFFPVYQGIRDNRKQSPTYGQIVKYECLMRLQTDAKVLSPYFFLGALERSGEITRATRIMIMKSFEYMSRFQYEFSINLTEKDLMDETMLEFVQFQLIGNKVAPERVTFEILEGVSSLATGNVIKILHELRKIGCRIAIDDFGAEQSNISRLLDFAPDYIKIDAKFIKNLPQDKNSRILVENIYDLALRMGVEVVAEFVSNQQIQNILEEIGVHYSQGYLFSEPSPDIPLFHVPH